MTKTKRVDFDEYADRYEDMLRGQLAFFSEDRGYFSEYKVAIAKEYCPAFPSSVLDFGCGIGLSLPHLISYFPNAQIFASDISEQSLNYVRANIPSVTALSDQDISRHTYDVIFVTGVFHHVPIYQREDVIKRLVSLLADGGQLCIFEHNPFNPVTRHMVATCPFDEDAELITRRNMQRLVTGIGGLKISASGYCLFFPQSLSKLRPLEKFLRWLPGGGQYFVIGSK